MLNLDQTARTHFRDGVFNAAQRREVRDAMANLYLALQQQVELRRPLCATSGRCCRFDAFGHRLFVTTMEMASFLHDLPPAPAAAAPAGASGAGCPFQHEKLCSVHAIRPFGCRVFFCDDTSTDWQRRQYESFHAELKRLHERLDVPYFYVEWRQALAIVLGGRP